VVDRRVKLMAEEGVNFVTNTWVGKSYPTAKLRADFDAVVLCGGATAARDLPVEGRNLKGVHFAMEFLPQANKRCHGDELDQSQDILAAGKHAIIIGGGDTGADCLGTVHRQKAASVHQFEIMSMPPADRSPQTPWPLWPMQLRIEGAHEEGGTRGWSIATTKFTGDENGNVKQLHGIKVGPPPKFEPIAGTEFVMDCDLALLAMGFTGPVRAGMIQRFGVKLDARGNIETGSDYMSSMPGVFAAGDMRRGQSLVVWAIAEGRKAAASIDVYLKRPEPKAKAKPRSRFDLIPV
jgi:glutamate synthase (NADPH/NADH) small chain